MLSLFRLAWLNLARRRVSTTVAFLAITVSVAASGVLLRLYRLAGSRFDSIARGGSAVIGAKASDIDILLGSLNLEGAYPGFIPLVLGQNLGRGMQFADGAKTSGDGVRAVIPLLYFAKAEGFRVIGTTAAFLNRPDAEDSPQLAQGAWAKGAMETVLGAEVARATGHKVGDRITAAKWTEDASDAAGYFELTVSGILAPTQSAWDRALYGRLEDAYATMKNDRLEGRSIWKTEVVNYFLVYVSPEGLPGLRALINQRSVAEVISITDTRRRLEELTGSSARLGLVLTALILFLGGLSVSAMMVTRAEAMAVQLAMLRALGYRISELACWLSWEGTFLGGAAVAAGALLDAVLFPLFRNLLGSALPPQPIPLWQSAPVWALALLSTITAGLLPLVRLARQNIHAALKGL